MWYLSKGQSTSIHVYQINDKSQNNVLHIKSPFWCNTKPHVHKKIEIFWKNIASTMACLNFNQNGPKKWTLSFRD